MTYLAKAAAVAKDGWTEAEVRNIRALYAAWGAADDAWMEALRADFPKRHQGDVRYLQEGKGEPGTPLRAAYDVAHKAQNEFYLAGGRQWLMGQPKP